MLNQSLVWSCRSFYSVLFVSHSVFLSQELILYLFLHFPSAQTSSGIKPQDSTPLYLKYFILSRNGRWCPSRKEFTIPLFKTSQKDIDIGRLNITILQHSCPTLTEVLPGAEAAACIHAAHTRAQPHNPPVQSWAALNTSSSMPGGEDGHSTQRRTTRILAECCDKQPSWPLSGG